MTPTNPWPLFFGRLRGGCSLGHAQRVSWRRHGDLAQAVVCPLTCALVVLPAFAGALPQAGRTQEAAFEAYRRADPLVHWPLEKLRRQIPELQRLEPAQDQAALPAILKRVSDNLQTFLDNFENTTSLETVEESRSPSSAFSVDTVREQFRYLMLATPGNAAKIEEYRTDLRSGQPSDRTTPGFIKTTGFASLPLFFSANDQPLSEFRCLGSEVVDGRRTEVVAFAERPEPAGVMTHFLLPAESVPLLVQGVAWIDSTEYQVLRMRTELLAPQAEAHLDRVTSTVSFHPVSFRGGTVVFWLPEEVQVTVDLQGRTYRNRHYYSDYQVFTVETEQKKTTKSPCPPP